jgi:hypothetical protein
MSGQGKVMMVYRQKVFMLIIGDKLGQNQIGSSFKCNKLSNFPKFSNFSFKFFHFFI